VYGWLTRRHQNLRNSLQDGRDWVKVTVKGKAREIRSAGIDFEVAPIRYKADKELAPDCV
jgi:hypothetical protein